MGDDLGRGQPGSSPLHPPLPPTPHATRIRHIEVEGYPQEGEMDGMKDWPWGLWSWPSCSLVALDKATALES